MIKQLKPSIIEKNWSKLAGIICTCLPPEQYLASYATSAVKSALIAGDMQCWAITENDKTVALALTAVYVDRFVGARALMVYGLYTAKEFSNGLWQEWMTKMSEYAKLKDCYNVVSIKGLRR